MKQIIVVRDNGYWAKGKTMKDARVQYKKQSRKFPSSRASFTLLRGDDEKVEKTYVDDMGGIVFHQEVEYIEL
jgi:hypothetical protein